MNSCSNTAVAFLLVSLLLGSEDVCGQGLYALTERLMQLEATGPNNAAHFINVNVQQPAGQFPAGNPLLNVQQQAYNLITVQRLRALYPSAGTSNTAINNFLNAVANTPIMRATETYLRNQGVHFPNMVQLLRRLWFTQYMRHGQPSSGFKHVFMGERKYDNQTAAWIVNGLHNWAFYSSEQPRIQYMGFFRNYVFTNGKGRLLKIRYRWNNMLKDRGSMFLGTSPELEMALYTVCVTLHAWQNCNVSLSNFRFQIWTMYHHHPNNAIGTAYPVI